MEHKETRNATSPVTPCDGSASCKWPPTWLADVVAIVPLTRSPETDLVVVETSDGVPFVDSGACLRPHLLPWRPVVATWPTPWRERWGRLANDLMDSGRSWPDDEGEAFTIVEDELRAAELNVA